MSRRGTTALADRVQCAARGPVTPQPGPDLRATSPRAEYYAQLRTPPRTCGRHARQRRLFQPRGDSMTARNVQTAIVLQGGGALGAYEYGVLKALYESAPRIPAGGGRRHLDRRDHRRGARRCRGRPDPRAGHAVAAQADRGVPGARAVAARPDRPGAGHLRQPRDVPAAGRAVHHALAAHQHLRHRTAAARPSPSSSTRDGSTTTPPG